MNELPVADQEQLQASNQSLQTNIDTAMKANPSLIDAWLERPTQAMLDLASVRTRSRVLDVAAAAAAGRQTLEAARRTGAQGYVLAIDMSADELDKIAAIARESGLHNIETKVISAENMGLPEASFDAAVCQLGLMFRPDPTQSLREIYAALKQGGRLCTMVFSDISANPCIAAVLQTAAHHAGLSETDPNASGGLFSLGRPGLIDEIFNQAGFSDTMTIKISLPCKLPSANAYINFLRMTPSPALRILKTLEPAVSEEAWAEIEEKLAVFQTATAWEGPTELLLTVGNRT